MNSIKEEVRARQRQGDFSDAIFSSSENQNMFASNGGVLNRNVESDIDSTEFNLNLILQNLQS